MSEIQSFRSVQDMKELSLNEAKSAWQKCRVEVGYLPRTTFEEELALGQTIAHTETAQEKQAAIQALVEGNLKLPLQMTRKFIDRGLDREDLFEEAYFGLRRAAEKYDYRKNNRFCKYASGWVRQFMSRAIADRGKTIRVPVHTDDKCKRYFTVINFLFNKLQRDPTREEVAVEMGINVEQVKNIEEVFEMDVNSLDQPIPGAEDKTYMELEADKTIDDPECEIQRKRTKELVLKAMKDLSPLRQSIMYLAYYKGEDNMAEIGRRLGYSREWVRLEHRKAAQQMRQRIRELLGEDYDEILEDTFDILEQNP